MATVNLASMRSALFVPLADDRFLVKAHQRGADALLLDLEDSVPPARKAEARARLPEAARRLASAGALVMARINSTPEHRTEDLKAAARSPLAAVFLPKVESIDDIESAERELHAADTRLFAMLESPASVLAAPVLARAGRRLAGLVFGSEDYCGMLGISSASAALDWPAHMVAAAARAQGLAAFGAPGPVAEIADMEAFEHLQRKAKAMGFTGFACIHPKQVEVVNRVYSPSGEELEQAREIVVAAQAAEREGLGAFALRGRMIDAPVVAQAHATLARAR